MEFIFSEVKGGIVRLVVPVIIPFHSGIFAIKVNIGNSLMVFKRVSLIDKEPFIQIAFSIVHIFSYIFVMSSEIIKSISRKMNKSISYPSS